MVAQRAKEGWTFHVFEMVAGTSCYLFLDDGSDSSYVRDDVITAVGLDADEGNLRWSTLTDSYVALKSKKAQMEKPS